MEEVYMIPQKDLDQLSQYYKGELTENALLNKLSGHVSRQKNVLLADPQLPPAMANAQTKPLSHELTKLTKRIRQFPGGVGVGAPGGSPGEEGEEDEGDLVTGPVEQWLKRMIKGSPSTPKSHITPSAKKGKAASTSQIPIKKGTPSTSRGDIRSRLEAVRERRKTWEKYLAESSLGKGKGPPREVEQLKPLPLSLHEKGLYDIITRLPGSFGSSYVCAHCWRPYNDAGRHRCSINNKKVQCRTCCQKECPDFLHAYPRGLKATRRCQNCHRDFFGDTCYETHCTKDHTGKPAPCPQYTVCFRRRRCPTCLKLEVGFLGIQRHQCGYLECPSCHEYVDAQTNCCFTQRALIPQEL